MSDVDDIEVGRAAHEIANRLGREAWKYAARWSDEAAGMGKPAEAAFWRAVSAALKPRDAIRPADHVSSGGNPS